MSGIGQFIEHFGRYAPTDPRLGRNIVHDWRSWDYRLPEPAEGSAIPTQVRHVRDIPILDQGKVGACTAYATLGMLATEPYASKLRARGVDLSEFDTHEALGFYHDETLIDDRAIPGHYPPDDTGSAAIYAGKVAVARKWIDGYAHAFSWAATLHKLGSGPVILGIPWLNSMFDPDANGVLDVDASSGVAGGHEIEAVGYDLSTGLVDLAGSWGTSWGLDGYVRIPVVGLRSLLRQGGDVLAPIFTS